MTFMLSADLEPRISRNVAGMAIAGALRRFVGRGRPYTVKELANATGIKDRVIECAMCHPAEREHRPLKPEALFSIIAILGPEFATEALKPVRHAAYRTDGIEPAEPSVIVADCATDTAEVARAAADGRLTIHERRKLAEVGQRHVERGMMLVAMGAAV